jgi:hypothetical protein
MVPRVKKGGLVIFGWFAKSQVLGGLADFLSRKSRAGRLRLRASGGLAAFCRSLFALIAATAVSKA